MIRKTSIKYIYTYISFFTTSSATKTSQLKKKKKPTTVLTLKTENKNDSIKNKNNFFLGGPGGQRPPLDPPGSASGIGRPSGDWSTCQVSAPTIFAKDGR